MGSRYGGLKQLDALGPHGETIMDYSVYDAVRAGFGRVVFVIRHDFEEEFNNRVLSRYRDFVPVSVVFQDTTNLPEGFSAPAGRTKPWGTGHAVLMGEQAVSEPFAVINADDFYGAEAFEVIARFLSNPDRGENDYCMVAYQVGNTMTKNGSVSRGVCTVDADNHLQSVVERRAICYTPEGTIAYEDEADNTVHCLDSSVPVSMNLWGLGLNFFRHGKKQFVDFLKKYAEVPGSEFYIPSVVDSMIKHGTVTCEVLHTGARWFGVTYASDRQGVTDALNTLHETGVYPESLFGN